MNVQDFWFLLVALLFFALSIAFTYGCDRL